MKEKYDVIIIGAGVAGLTCGCYLAKAGLKVLIAEQHYIPGGYCTSFKRKGYVFDVGVHYFGSGRKGGQIDKVVKELALDVQFFRFDPTDKIILPEHEICIRNNVTDTKEEFKLNFMKESKNIDRFFDFLQHRNFLFIYSKIKKMSFCDLLEEFFDDYKLKAALIVLLGNIGLPSKKIAALTAVTLFREFIFDGGYYPKGGVQGFPDALAKKFEEYGGVLMLSSMVNNILTKDGRIEGVILKKEKIIADFVVAACDANNIFNKLLDIKTIEREVVKKLSVSTSGVAVYLGVNKDLFNILKDSATNWLFSTYNVDNCYLSSIEDILERRETDYVMCTFPSLREPALAESGKSTMELFVNASCQGDDVNSDFWKTYKGQIGEVLIDKAEKIIPGLQKFIEVKEIATPLTFKRFTLNYGGAMYGWASMCNQIDVNTFPQQTSVKGLLIAGHWCTHGLGQGGVSVSVFSGRTAAKLVLAKIKK
ncbi:MAG: NAD(P)/FAD-dependent oxidoreductase [Candidatus Omnitrophica bacterium]|nr:NAD(P)/FAD-dependent oxidoreductase [Candidatus Omnitrophota bacterium]